MLNSRSSSNIPMKYTVLKPTTKIRTIIKNTIKRNNEIQRYSLSSIEDESYRIYHIEISSMEKYLQEIQWRFDVNAPIVHAIYVEILPKCNEEQSKHTVKVDLYLEHIELLFKDLKKLVLSQAIYLLTECLLGYQILFKKYKNISINQNAIGLDTKGFCRVWINQQFNQMKCEKTYVSDERSIIRTLIEIISSKIQSKSFNYFKKMIEELTTSKFNFENSHQYIQNSVINQQIKVPSNLKYLICQNQIRSTLTSFPKFLMRRSKEEAAVISLNEVNDEIAKSVSPKFANKNRRHTHNAAFLQNQLNKLQITINKLPIDQRNSQSNSKYLQKSKQQIPCSPPKQINPHNYLNIPVIQSQKKKNQFQTLKKQTSIKRLPSFISPQKSLQRKKVRRYSQPNIEIINILHQRKLIETKKSKAQSRDKSQSLKKKGPLNQSNFTKCCSDNESKVPKVKISGLSSEFFQSDKANNDDNFNVKTSMNEGNIQKIIEYNSDSQSLSNKSVKNQLLIKKDSITQKLQKRECILKANCWTNTIQNLLDLSQKQTKLDISITEGQQVSSYLDDVRLQKLQKLSKGLTESLIPEDFLRLKSA